MTLKGSDLAPGNQEQAVEVRLQFAHVVKMRSGVVVGDGHEVESARGRGLQCDKGRAGYFLAALTRTASVAVARVHVEVAAVPPARFLERLVDESPRA